MRMPVKTLEQRRTYTRASVDPFLCFQGRGRAEDDQGDGVFLRQEDLEAMQAG